MHTTVHTTVWEPMILAAYTENTPHSSTWEFSTEKWPSVIEQLSLRACVSHFCFGDFGADKRPKGAGVRESETDTPRRNQQGHVFQHAASMRVQ